MLTKTMLQKLIKDGATIWQCDELYDYKILDWDLKQSLPKQYYTEVAQGKNKTNWKSLFDSKQKAEAYKRLCSLEM